MPISCVTFCVCYIFLPCLTHDRTSNVNHIVHSALSYSGATILISGAMLSFEFCSHNCMFTHSAVRLALRCTPLGHNFKNESRCLKSAVVVVVQYSLLLTIVIINQDFSLSLTLWLLLSFLFFVVCKTENYGKQRSFLKINFRKGYYTMLCYCSECFKIGS